MILIFPYDTLAMITVNITVLGLCIQRLRINGRKDLMIYFWTNFFQEINVFLGKNNRAFQFIQRFYVFFTIHERTLSPCGNLFKVFEFKYRVMLTVDVHFCHP